MEFEYLSLIPPEEPHKSGLDIIVLEWIIWNTKAGWSGKMRRNLFYQFELCAETLDQFQEFLCAEAQKSAGVDYLDPLFGSKDISAKEEYIEAHPTQAAQLTAGFNTMKATPASSLLQASNILQTGQPLAGSSFKLTVKNEVNLKQLMDNNGKT